MGDPGFGPWVGKFPGEGNDDLLSIFSENQWMEVPDGLQPMQQGIKDEPD